MAKWIVRATASLFVQREVEARTEKEALRKAKEDRKASWTNGYAGARATGALACRDRGRVMGMMDQATWHRRAQEAEFRRLGGKVAR